MKGKKLIIGLLAVLCAFTSCENKKQKPAPEVPEVDVMGYRPTEIRLTDDFDKVISLDTNVGDVYIFGQLKSGGYTGYTTDSSFSEYESFSFIPQENESVMTSALLPFGQKAVLTYLDGENFLYVYGKDGLQLQSIGLGSITDSPEVRVSVLPYGRNNYIINVDNKRLIIADKTGYLSDISTDGNITGFSRGAENTVNCLISDGSSEFIAGIDIDSATLTDKKKIVTDSSAYASCMSEKYSCISVMDGGIYGISDSTVKKITDVDPKWYMYVDNRNLEYIPEDEVDFIIANLDYGKYLYLLAKTFDGATIDQNGKKGNSKGWRNKPPFAEPTADIREFIMDIDTAAAKLGILLPGNTNEHIIW
ncbi:MAG: hypothetical protein K2H28_04900, partial [Ruminococcus sp.]|nr:hypothetical protein [Ruminococcus sp.]